MKELKVRIWDGNHNHYHYPEVIELNAGLEYELCANLKTDKGVDIYEGDKLGGPFDGCSIRYCDNCKSLQVWCDEPNECCACLGDVHWYEVVDYESKGKLTVIGNIHE